MKFPASYLLALAMALAAIQAAFSEAPTSTQPVEVLKNTGYTVGYSEAAKDPLWVNYSLTDATRSTEHTKRPKSSFETDLRTAAGVTTHDYKDTGYDRGHMAPSYAIGQFWGPKAQKETFIMTNVLPQLHVCNEGVWNSIERMEADDFAKRFGVIEVVDGPIFSATSERFASGVIIPTAFYKAIKRPDGQIIAFIVPQNPQSSRPEDYLASVDEIKAQTGIDPFPTASPEAKAVKRQKIW